MNNEIYETTSTDGFFDENSEKFEISELIQERAVKAKNFALAAMIVSGALFLIMIGSVVFSFLMFSPILTLISLPISIISVILEIVLMIGAIVMNIIALVNANKQQKELLLYTDGPEKDRLRKTVKLGQIFTYIGVGVAALSLFLIVPLNVLEFVLSFI